MPVKKWGALLPEQVSTWINFDRDDSSWHYGKGQAVSMASKQAEGVAYLWNLLALHGVALLADEVGMGKTFQALGVASLLWKMNPDARVLVMAPNRDICRHWQREYDAFLRDHYREEDGCVKLEGGGAVQAIGFCRNLDELASSVEGNAANLYLTTIYSLSGLVPQDQKNNDSGTIAKANAVKIRERVKKALGRCFDLIVIDEAHYFRNVDGGSQRASAAKGFFGERQDPLASKVLLMTATPSHTRLEDVANILGYFTDVGNNPWVPGLMSKYGLRRFRLMEANGVHYSKGQYRHEKLAPADFSQRPQAEMFFALYQKKLVTELGCARENKQLTYGFLEGFESIGRAAARNKSSGQKSYEEIEENVKGDFGKAPDTALLERLTGQYYSSFNKFPDHPKYGNLVQQCIPPSLFDAPRALHEDKHLVFVRRIPSVRELTQRINEAYDAILAARIYTAWGLKADGAAVKRWCRSSWSRKVFNQIVSSSAAGGIDDLELDDIQNDEEMADSHLGSAIADLFVAKKGKNGRTDCTNVSLRFRKPESIFALFLEPPVDYIDKGYTFFYEYPQSGKVRADYVGAAQEGRFKAKMLPFQKTDATKVRELDKISYKRDMTTAWSLIYPQLSKVQRDKIQGWSQTRPGVAENFANYLRTGFLFASPVMVELYAWFTEFNRFCTTTDAQKKYSDFVDFVKPKIPVSLMMCYFKSALDSFEVLCEKIIDHKLDDWQKDWRSLTSLQNPAWYASGQSGDRQRLILGFNSPFYPNVLVSTSVFQEGVNLHLQCTRVHHYGIAWSPGDNEQRVGRVDRLFGKVNEQLKVDKHAELEIYFPFLKNSFDEDQLASFIVRKFHVEEKIDACMQPGFDRRVDLTQTNWQEFLRRPDKSIFVRDPYGARFSPDFLPDYKYTPWDPTAKNGSG
jgi:hypothetical protein